MTKHDKQPRIKVNFRIKKKVIEDATKLAEQNGTSLARLVEQSLEYTVEQSR